MSFELSAFDTLLSALSYQLLAFDPLIPDPSTEDISTKSTKDTHLLLLPSPGIGRGAGGEGAERISTSSPTDLRSLYNPIRIST